MPSTDIQTESRQRAVDDRSTPRDDAPAATAKHRDADRELVGRAVTINRPSAELYAYFRDFANLATFMENIVRVDVRDPTHSHWVVKAPGGKTVEWDATVTEEREGESITWQSDDGADVPNSGRITFRDVGARGTVVTATVAYDPPAGTVGKLIAKLFQRERRRSHGIQMRRTISLRLRHRRPPEVLRSGTRRCTSHNLKINPALPRPSRARSFSTARRVWRWR